MDIKRLDGQSLRRIKAALFLLALIPCLQLIIGAISYDLGTNPIEKITRTTGYWTLTFLMVTLSVTPLRRLTGWLWWIRLRRMLSLFAFFYASLHFLTYLVLDQFFDWDSIIKDIAKRPYITVGFTTFLLMVPLALTSTNNMIKKLGGKNWRRLHRLVYLTAVGGVVHYWWLVKKDPSNPISFALVLMLLFGIRLYYLAKNANKG
ncbi:MAG: protein-methionine-sulfoxide reductase heme-binding subunit MsrQ [Methylovulum sp.]|nr:protein-methionine-sulfoxide reductase heme-binding subunit MsrQ [Methylovulum sp.]